MKIQDILKSLGESGCLLLCYAHEASISLIDLIENFENLVEEEIISKECFIYDANKLMKFFDKNITIDRMHVSKVPKGTHYITKFENNGFGHFVVLEGDTIIYNTLENSKCVNFGKMNKDVRVLCFH